MKSNLSLGAIIFLIGAAYIQQAGKIPRSSLDGAVSSSGFPLLIGWLLVAGAGLLVIQTILTVFLFRPAKAVEEPKGVWESPGHSLLMAGGLVVLITLYLLLLPIAGYALSVFLLIIAATRYQGVLIDFSVVAVALVGSVILYCLFVLLLGLPLPAGILFR